MLGGNTAERISQQHIAKPRIKSGDAVTLLNSGGHAMVIASQLKDEVGESRPWNRSSWDKMTVKC